MGTLATRRFLRRRRHRVATVCCLLALAGIVVGMHAVHIDGVGKGPTPVLTCVAVLVIGALAVGAAVALGAAARAVRPVLALVPVAPEPVRAQPAGPPSRAGPDGPALLQVVRE